MGYLVTCPGVPWVTASPVALAHDTCHVRLMTHGTGLDRRLQPILMGKASHALQDRSEAFGADPYGCDPKPCAATRAIEVCSSRLRRGVVLLSRCRSSKARASCGFVSGGWGRIGRGRSGSRRAVCRQRPHPVLSATSGTRGERRPSWPIRRSWRGAQSHPRVVCPAWTPAFQCFVGDLWPLAGELERRSIQDTHRCFLSPRRSEELRDCELCNREIV